MAAQRLDFNLTAGVISNQPLVVLTLFTGQRHHLAHHAGHFRLFARRGTRPVQIEHLPHDPGHAIDLVLDARHETVVLGIRRDRLFHQQKRVLDARQRIVNLVRHAGRDPAGGSQLLAFAQQALR